MAVKDIESNLKFVVALAAAISSDTNTDGAILDTAGSELGLVFALDIVAYTDGDYALEIFESDDAAMAGATKIDAPRLLPTDGAAVVGSAIVAAGGELAKLGVFGNKRYVQPRIVSTGTSSGATVRVIATQKSELVAV